MRRIIFTLVPLLTFGCVGDGGGTAYDGGVSGTEDGDSSQESGFFGTTDENALFDLCMEVCLDEAGAEYCREEVCEDLASNAGPGAGASRPINNCLDFDGDELSQLDDLGPDCLSCFCSASGNPQNACEEECGF